MDLTSPSLHHVDLVFCTRLTEERFSSDFSQLGIDFHKLPTFINDMLKSAMKKDPHHFLALTVRKDKHSRTIAEFRFSTTHAVGSKSCGRAHVMSLQLEELTGDDLFRYWVGRAKAMEVRFPSI